MRGEERGGEKQSREKREQKGKVRGVEGEAENVWEKREHRGKMRGDDRKVRERKMI